MKNMKFEGKLRDLDPGSDYSPRDIEDLNLEEIRNSLDNILESEELSPEEKFSKLYGKILAGKFRFHDDQEVQKTMEASVVDRILLYGPEYHEAGLGYADALFAKDAVELKYSDLYDEEERDQLSWNEAVDKLENSGKDFNDLEIDWRDMYENDGFQIESFNQEGIVLEEGEEVSYDQELAEYMGDWSTTYQAFLKDYISVLGQVFEDEEAERKAKGAAGKRTMVWRLHKVGHLSGEGYHRYIDGAVTPEIIAASGNPDLEQLPEGSSGRSGPSMYAAHYLEGIVGHDRRDQEEIKRAAYRLGQDVSEGLEHNEIETRLESLEDLEEFYQPNQPIKN